MLRFLFGRRAPERGPVKVLLGLGNPGPEYEATRHNVGWWVVDHLADVWRVEGSRKEGETLTATGIVAGQRVRLVKPLTYMNLSGRVLRPYLRREGWFAATDLLVITDDVALPIGTSRLRAKGSAGGHNGLKSVEQALGSQEYPRLRVGIKPRDPRRRVDDLADFVLDRFGREEREIVLAQLPAFVDTVEIWLRDGIDRAMNAHNSQPSTV